MKERLYYIDWLKGLAMIMVVMGHIIIFCGQLEDSICMKNIVMINMPLFFCLNGLVVKSFPIDNGNIYLLKKIRQIFIPFIAWGCLITLYRHESFLNFWYSFWKFGYWYLLVLFELYILYYICNIIIKFIDRQICNPVLKNSGIIFTFIAGYFAVRLGVRFLPSNFLSITSYFQILEYYPFFFIGVVIKQFDLLKYLKEKAGVIMTLLLISTPVFYWLWNIGSEKGALAWWILFLLRVLFILALLITAHIYFNRPDRYVGRIFNTIGRHTLSIYMIQYYFFSTIDFHDLYGLLDQSGNQLAIVILSFVTSVLLCYLCIIGERIIQTSPLLNAILLGKISNQSSCRS